MEASYIGHLPVPVKKFIPSIDETIRKTPSGVLGLQSAFVRGEGIGRFKHDAFT
jgi:hypothetical protein